MDLRVVAFAGSCCSTYTNFLSSFLCLIAAAAQGPRSPTGMQTVAAGVTDVAEHL